MLKYGLDLLACRRLLGMAIQRQGELVIWFSAELENGTRRWAAVYRYLKSFWGRATDCGQTVQFSKLSEVLGAMTSGIDVSSLDIGGTSIQIKKAIQLVRKELKSDTSEVSKLDSAKLSALVKKLSTAAAFRIRNTEGKAAFDEFLVEQERANANGSHFKPFAQEHPDEWETKFLDLLGVHGGRVYTLYWDTGEPGAGADLEYIDFFLGCYWARSSTEGISGPYETFREILEDETFSFITSVVEQIWCSALTAEELVPKLVLDQDTIYSGHKIEINGETYEVDEDGRLLPVRENEEDFEGFTSVASGELGLQIDWRQGFETLGEVQAILARFDRLGTPEAIDWKAIIGDHSYFGGISSADFPPLYNARAFEDVFVEFLAIVREPKSEAVRGLGHFDLYVEKGEKKDIVQYFVCFLGHLKSLKLLQDAGIV